MTVRKKITAFAAVFMFIAFFALIRVYANSAEPPSLVIWSVNAPADTELVFTYSDGSTYTVDKSLRLWEKCWFLYGNDYIGFHDYSTNEFKPHTGIKLTARSSKKSFDITLPEESSGGSFKSIYTLDFNDETLTENVSSLRAPFYMLLRVMFTLVIECGFYYLVGYRKKRSYIAFITVNLITQTFVNFVINGGSLDIFGSYTMLTYIGMEFIVFLFEMGTLPIAVKEKKAGWTLLWTFTANDISMFIGGIALMFVPF